MIGDGKMIESIGNKKIGNEQFFVIAEIGINHNGDIDICKKMIDNGQFIHPWVR